MGVLVFEQLWVPIKKILAMPLYIQTEVNSVLHRMRHFLLHTLASEIFKFKYLQLIYTSNNDFIFQIVEEDGSLLEIGKFIYFIFEATTSSYFTGHLFKPYSLLKGPCHQ